MIAPLRDNIIFKGTLQRGAKAICEVIKGMKNQASRTGQMTHKAKISDLIPNPMTVQGGHYKLEIYEIEKVAKNDNMRSIKPIFHLSSLMWVPFEITSLKEYQ